MLVEEGGMPLLVAGKWGQGHPYSVQIQSKTDLTL